MGMLARRRRGVRRRRPVAAPDFSRLPTPTPTEGHGAKRSNMTRNGRSGSRIKYRKGILVVAGSTVLALSSAAGASVADAADAARVVAQQSAAVDAIRPRCAGRLGPASLTSSHRRI